MKRSLDVLSNTCSSSFAKDVENILKKQEEGKIDARLAPTANDPFNRSLVIDEDKNKKDEFNEEQRIISSLDKDYIKFDDKNFVFLPKLTKLNTVNNNVILETNFFRLFEIYASGEYKINIETGKGLFQTKKK